MKTALLLTVVIGLGACSQPDSLPVQASSDSIPAANRAQIIPAKTVAAREESTLETNPGLPFFKDVFDVQRLFW